MQVAIDVSDQSSSACQKEHCGDATWAQSLDLIAQFVVEEGGGDLQAVDARAGGGFRCGGGRPLVSSQFVQDT